MEHQHQVSMGIGVAVQAAGEPLGTRKGQLNLLCSPAAADPLLMSDQKRSVEGCITNSNAHALSSEEPHFAAIEPEDIVLLKSRPEIASLYLADVGRQCLQPKRHTWWGNYSQAALLGHARGDIILLNLPSFIIH